MEGIITRGTTVAGRSVNEGDHVDISEDDYRKLLVTGDIKPIPNPPDEGKPSEAEEKPAAKKRK